MRLALAALALLAATGACAASRAPDPAACAGLFARYDSAVRNYGDAGVRRGLRPLAAGRDLAPAHPDAMERLPDLPRRLDGLEALAQRLAPSRSSTAAGDPSDAGPPRHHHERLRRAPRHPLLPRPRLPLPRGRRRRASAAASTSAPSPRRAPSTRRSPSPARRGSSRPTRRPIPGSERPVRRGPELEADVAAVPSHRWTRGVALEVSCQGRRGSVGGVQRGAVGGHAVRLRRPRTGGGVLLPTIRADSGGGVQASPGGGEGGAAEGSGRLRTAGGSAAGGLVAYRGGEPVGWYAVEPRPAYPGLLRVYRVPWAGRSENRADRGRLGVNRVFIRAGFPRQGVSRALARAAVGFARERGARALEGYPRLTRAGAGDRLGRDERRCPQRLGRRRSYGR